MTAGWTSYMRGYFLMNGPFGGHFKNCEGNAPLQLAFLWEGRSGLAPLTCKDSLSTFHNLHDSLLQLPSNNYSLKCSPENPAGTDTVE